MSLFDGVFNTAPQQQAAADQSSSIQTGLNNLTSLYNTGQNQLQTNYTAALQPNQQNYATSQQGVNQLGNLLGLNGASGNQSALTSLQNTPGYQFQLGQGENQVLANQAATGQLNSGNTDIALNNYAQELAGTTYQNAVQNLQPYLTQSNNAASNIGSLSSGLGNQLNANSMAQGNAQYGGAASIGNANANAALAQSGANANSLSALTGMGGALMGFLSDANAKDDIEPVGELFDGQTVYRYRYHGDPRHQIGLIAQEVEDAAPDAVFHFDDLGMRGVDYKRATDRSAGYAAHLMRMAA